MVSNGHNVFGSDVAGNIAGDRENVAAGADLRRDRPRHRRRQAQPHAASCRSRTASPTRP